MHISSVLVELDSIEEAISFLDNQINKYPTSSYSRKIHTETNIFVK